MNVSHKRSSRPLIDIHTHLFPDAIADQAVRKLAAEAGITPFSDGTARSLLAQMKKNGVRCSVNQPVATRPEQVSGINRWILGLKREQGLISFGSMHPDFPGADEEIVRLKENGIGGIKLHPDYQQFHPDDEKLLPIYEACRANDMTVFFHAGVDLAYPYTHGTPARFVPVLGIRGLRVILAHVGGYRLWDEVERHILGKDVFIETSFCHEIEPARLAAMLQAHHRNRVLFGTDSPWGDAAPLQSYIEKLPLGEEFLNDIFYRNAAALLDMPVA